MKSIRIWRLFPLLPILFLCACSRSAVLAAPREPGEIIGAAAIRAEEDGKSDGSEPADTEELLRILEGAAEMQPGCAGSSLRLAALAGNLLRWMEANPGGGEIAADSLRSWAEKQDLRKLIRIRSTLLLLGEWAERLEASEIRDLLSDAGYSLSEQGPTREGFLALTKGLTEAVGPVIFKKHEE